MDYDTFATIKTRPILTREREKILAQRRKLPSFHFDNDTFLASLHDINYYGSLKTNKLHENRMCRLPELNPWEAKIKAILKPVPVFDKCVRHKPLTYIKGKQLFIDDIILKAYFKNKISQCKFAPVLRSAIQREGYILGEFKTFESGLELIDEVVKVACYNKAGQVEYEYVHSVIFRKEKLKEKGASDRRMNVLIMVFDSMSSSSFKRALPKTYEYLLSLKNFHNFDKFHTVGENTLPNLVPMLSGYQAEKLLGTENIPPPFDDFPFIWKNFSQK